MALKAWLVRDAFWCVRAGFSSHAVSTESPFLNRCSCCWFRSRLSLSVIHRTVQSLTTAWAQPQACLSCERDKLIWAPEIHSGRDRLELILMTNDCESADKGLIAQMLILHHIRLKETTHAILYSFHANLPYHTSAVILSLWLHEALSVNTAHNSRWTHRSLNNLLFAAYSC